RDLDRFAADLDRHSDSRTDSLETEQTFVGCVHLLRHLVLLRVQESHPVSREVDLEDVTFPEVPAQEAVLPARLRARVAAANVHAELGLGGETGWAPVWGSLGRTYAPPELSRHEGRDHAHRGSRVDHHHEGPCALGREIYEDTVRFVAFL